MKKTIKIIDLYVKIAKGEEVPKAIKYSMYGEGHNIFIYDEEEKEYVNDEEYLIVPNHHLNDEVEIIEKETKPITRESIEALGYAFGEIQKCFINGWNKSLENKPFKEDKEIEKLDSELYSNDDTIDGLEKKE